ncbi:group III truncated hemoglobin [Actinospongicola halichondriae]|uniref:group III truncated hemoglobin n=1 Tax=Actinospongicola halichondriae TaxID=3236844 RepID=UPI003D383934
MKIVRAPGLASDLDSRAEVHDLVVDFYREIAMDDLLGPVFGEVAEVDWAAHIPRLIDYWCRVLLGEPGYDGHILRPHERVHALEPFTPAMFERWLVLFVASVDGGWRGPLADQAKVHAGRIAAMLSRRLTGDPFPAEAR